MKIYESLSGESGGLVVGMPMCSTNLPMDFPYLHVLRGGDASWDPQTSVTS